MSHRSLGSMGLVATVIVVVSLALVPVAAQAQTAAADTRTVPRTAWGQPDLRGIWDFRTITPLERPSKLAGKQVLTETEAAELEEQTAQSRVGKPRDPGSLHRLSEFRRRAIHGSWLNQAETFGDSVSGRLEEGRDCWSRSEYR